MILTEEEIKKLLPQRPVEAHKGTFGKVLVHAGSDKYPGAAYLACASAYKVGAGLVTLASDRFVREITAKKISEVTYIDLNEVKERLPDYNSFLIGLGLGREKKTTDFIWDILSSKGIPKAIVDADGLNALSDIDRWWEKVEFEGVLTPHPGEMSRLTGLSVKEIQSSREKVAREFARKWKKVVVLKGADSIISSSNGESVVNPFANPDLATAGTGDVLSGIIAGLLAQGLTPFDAAKVGCFIHGMSGEGITLASDLIGNLPGVIKSLRVA